jgi:hypothetical protein
VGGEKEPGLEHAPKLMRDHQLAAGLAPREDVPNQFGRFIPGNAKTRRKKKRASNEPITKLTRHSGQGQGNRYATLHSRPRGPARLSVGLVSTDRNQAGWPPISGMCRTKKDFKLVVCGLRRRRNPLFHWALA